MAQVEDVNTALPSNWKVVPIQAKQCIDAEVIKILHFIRTFSYGATVAALTKEKVMTCLESRSRSPEADIHRQVFKPMDCAKFLPHSANPDGTFFLFIMITSSQLMRSRAEHAR